MPAILTFVWAASVADAPPVNASSSYLIEAGTQPGVADVALIETEGPVVTYVPFSQVATVTLSTVFDARSNLSNRAPVGYDEEDS